MARKKQVWRYTTAHRKKVLETAQREKLSGAQVAKRFGISMWTYYSWRSPARGIHVKAKTNGTARPGHISEGSNREVTVTKGKGRGARYSVADKRRILEAARKGNLTGAEVGKRFGISPLTYYRWHGPTGGRKAGVGRPRSNNMSAGMEDLRSAVRAQIQQVLPRVIREEVDAYITETLGGQRGPTRGRSRR